MTGLKHCQHFYHKGIEMKNTVELHFGKGVQNHGQVCLRFGEIGQAMAYFAAERGRSILRVADVLFHVFPRKEAAARGFKFRTHARFAAIAMKVDSEEAKAVQEDREFYPLGKKFCRSTGVSPEFAKAEIAVI